MKEWDVFTLALLNFERTRGEETTACAVANALSKKVFRDFPKNSCLFIVRATRLREKEPTFLDAPIPLAGGRSKKEEAADSMLRALEIFREKYSKSQLACSARLIA